MQGAAVWSPIKATPGCASNAGTGNLMNHINIQYAIVSLFRLKGFVCTDLPSVGRKGLAESVGWQREDEGVTNI